MGKTTMKAHFDMSRVKTRSVELIIYSLVDNITSISETYQLPPGENPNHLVSDIEKSVQEFLQKGQIALDESLHLARNDEDIRQLESALQDVHLAGGEMKQIGYNFIHNSSSIQHRAQAVDAGRKLLYAMSYLLIIADQIDVSGLLSDIDAVDQALRELASSSNIMEVEHRYSVLQKRVEEVSETVRRRIADLKDPDQRLNLLAAESQLISSMPLIYTAIKCFIQHRSEEARDNVSFAHGEAQTALRALKEGLNDVEVTSLPYSSLSHGTNLACMFNEFQNKVYLEPGTYRSRVHKPELEDSLEQIISRAGSKLADTDNTRETRKGNIVDECNKLRQALQHLLDRYEESVGKTNYGDEVDRAMVHVGNSTKDLKRHLRRAAVDHVSDAFLDTSTCLLELIDQAANYHPDRGINPDNFLANANGMIKAAEAACEMSSDYEGVRIIRHLCRQLEKLAPQVVQAALFLAAYPDSEEAHQNMNQFRDAWEQKVNLLTMAVDAIITLDDFLAVSELHIIEDVQTGQHVLRRKEYDNLDSVAGMIRGRARRVCSVIDEEIDSLPIHGGSDKVKLAAKRLRDRHIPRFERDLTDICVRENKDVSDEEHQREQEVYIEACEAILEGVKEIRNALLLNRNPDDVDSDNEYEEEAPVAAEDAVRVTDTDNQQKIMRLLPEQDKKVIKEQLDRFKLTQTHFEREVAKWSETGNDLIVLAKHMSMIMMNMTDFTRGRGPLRTTMDVIAAAQEISVDGTKLCALAQQIADESADSQSKKDLKANLSKIPTYCQQLNICSRVKADVQQIGDEFVVTGLDSATSLIQTARNLLSAVVQTVKDAFIASTKFRRPNSSKPMFEWKMAPPQKQPLVRVQRNTSVIRRASERRPMRPEQALAQFS